MHTLMLMFVLLTGGKWGSAPASPIQRVGPEPWKMGSASGAAPVQRVGPEIWKMGSK